MATWEDGPEYAPHERPARFDSPDAAALVDAPPVVDLSVRAPVEAPPVVDLSVRAPVEQPGFTPPSAPVTDLATLVPGEMMPPRDPREPFEVVTATLTPDALAGPTRGTGPGAWAAAHWSPPIVPAAPSAGPWGPPAGQPWAPPTAPLSITSAPTGSSAPGGFPAPGTPQWFGPGPSQPAPTVSVVDAKAIITAATPGVLVTLALGVIYVLAPLTLCTAFFLSSRVRVGRAAVRQAFLTALAVLGLAALGAALTNLYGVGAWWATVSRWALVLSLILLIVVPLIVRHELRQQREHAERWP